MSSPDGWTIFDNPGSGPNQWINCSIFTLSSSRFSNALSEIEPRLDGGGGWKSSSATLRMRLSETE